MEGHGVHGDPILYCFVDHTDHVCSLCTMGLLDRMYIPNMYMVHDDMVLLPWDICCCMVFCMAKYFVVVATAAGYDERRNKRRNCSSANARMFCGRL